MNIKQSPRKFSFLVALTVVLCAGAVHSSPADESQNAGAGQRPDYRSRTIYLAFPDRFHADDPYNPYVDPQYPTANNSVNCFTGNCDTEVEYRSYWGGDIPGFIQRLDYLQDLGIGAVWFTPMYEGVRDYEAGIGYGTDYHGYWVASKKTSNASQQITKQIEELGDWRGTLCARLRKLINEADPNLTEEVKWGTAVWTSNELVCAVGAFKDHVKLNFFKSASLNDPKGLFNAGLDAKATRAIDFAKGRKD
jgi:hypothetical protein